MESRMTEQRVTISLDEGVADVRLARPDKLNALDPAMFAGIIAAIAELEATPGLRAVVLSGEGRGFCAGLDMAYTAREFGAEEAQALGFVTRIAEDPHAEATALAQAIAARNPQAIRATKRLANLEGDAAAILAAESAEQAALLRTPNQIEAVMANMQKRPPIFTD
jgi:enoyl-CoA hydratase/carnithine racemase